MGFLGVLVIASAFSARREQRGARVVVRPLGPCETPELARALVRRLEAFGAVRTDVRPREGVVEIEVRAKDPGRTIRRACRRGLTEFRFRASEGEGEGEELFEVRRRWDLADPSRIEVKRVSHILAAEPELAVERFDRVEFHTEAFEKTPVIELEFSPADAERMRRIFKAHGDEEMALVLDGQVVAVARISGEMPGNTLQLRNLVDRAGARRLSKALRAGALPCEVEIVRLEETD